MTTTKVRTLSFNLDVNVPDSVEEFDQLAGRQGACLEQAVLNIIYRSVLAQFRASFCEALEESTGIARETKDTGRTRKVKTEHADGSVTEETEAVLVYSETEVEYVDRVFATIAQRDGSSIDAVVAANATLAQNIASKIDFDPSERAASGGTAAPKKVGKTFMALAEKLIAMGKGPKNADKLTQLLGIPVDGTNAVSLGRAIQENERRKKAAIEQEYTS